MPGNVHIQFDDEQLRTMVAEYMFGKLTDESQTSIIAKALEHLLERPYGRESNPTRMQEVFNDAVANVLKTMAEEWLREPEMQEKLAGLLHEAAEKVFVTDRPQHVEKMAEAISKALTNRY